MKRISLEVQDVKEQLVEVSLERNLDSLEAYRNEGLSYFLLIVKSIHEDQPTRGPLPRMTLNWLNRWKMTGFQIKNPKTRVYKHVQSLSRDQGISVDDAMRLWLENPKEDAYTYLRPAEQWREVVESMAEHVATIEVLQQPSWIMRDW